MIHKVGWRTSILAILMALAMLLTSAPAFAQGHHGGGGGGGGGGSSHSPVKMYSVQPPTTDSSATIGWTISKGYGSATLRIMANLPLPASCVVPYSVRLKGSTLTTPATTPIDITTYLASLGKSNPRVMLAAGEAGAPVCDQATGVWRLNGVAIAPGTLVEWAYNQDFAKGFKGTAEVFNNTTDATLFAYPNPATTAEISLLVRINPHKGSGEEG